MDASLLAQTQQRLEEHFNELARKRHNSGLPIFALEHGLDESERREIRRELATRSPSPRHWLLWVVYATEVGYEYEGDEYWGSFERQTPRWEYHQRARIKAWFRKFRKEFGGVIPSGPWAEHFSIIAWPITHAILPLYLQRQFAKLLYGLRFRLASRTARDARGVGRLLAIHALGGPARFSAFLEQEELTGQIVVALLGGEATEGQFVHSPTLRRIVADLEKARNAREWLKETQRVVADRFKGIGRGWGSGPESTPGSLRDGSPVDLSHLAIGADLALRHRGAGHWSAFVEVRSFRPVAALSAEIQRFLDRTRCRLSGADDFKPSGWLLSGDRKGALRRWPDSGAPLIRFERANAMVDHLLESECRIHGGPVWAFRIGGDGIGRHTSGGIVRPGVDYMVVAAPGTLDGVDGLERCELECEGVEAYRLQMPPFVSAEMTAQLKEFGLNVARTIRVWPVGLPGRGWDGEGNSEWLTTESPCFGIAQDHPMESLAFCLNGGSETLIRTDDAGGPVFVRLRPLRAGVHTLTVRARRSAALERVAPTAAAEGFVRLAVREPEPWTPGHTSHEGLIVRVDPDHANLDTFWRNNVNLSVNGPQGFTAAFHVTLQAADGRQLLSELVGAPMSLPIEAETWRKRFDRFLNSEARAWRYLEAADCTLAIKGETLGTCTLRFGHEPLPVRWAIQRKRDRVVVRLVNDSGQEEADAVVRFYTMERPFEGRSLGEGEATAGSAVEPPGGLFVARHGRHCDAVVVSAKARRQGLEDLGVECRVSGLERSVRALSGYFRILRLWGEARLSGFLAVVRHRRVMEGAAAGLYGALCGENWARAEQQVRARPESEAAVESLAGAVDKRGDFGTVLREGLAIHGSVDSAMAWFVDAAARQNICRQRDLSEFAVLLAGNPRQAVDHPSFEALLGRLVDNPALLRSARLLVLQRSWVGRYRRDGAAPSRPW